MCRLCPRFWCAEPLVKVQRIRSLSWCTLITSAYTAWAWVSSSITKTFWPACNDPQMAVFCIHVAEPQSKTILREPLSLGITWHAQCWGCDKANVSCVSQRCIQHLFSEISQHWDVFFVFQHWPPNAKEILLLRVGLQCQQKCSSFYSFLTLMLRNNWPWLKGNGGSWITEGQSS